MRYRFALAAALFALALSLSPTPAHAQNNWPTPGGAGAGGAVIMCLNPSGQAIPATSAGTCLGTGSGGGGAVTMASGAVAAGAYSSGAYAVGSGTDGWNVTEGTKADAAYAGAGSASMVAALKGIYNVTSAATPAGTATIGAVYPSTGSANSGTTTLVNGTTAAMTATTSTQVLALVAAKKLYVTFVKCNNSSTTVSTLVQIQDGSGGAVLTTLAAGANFGGEVNQNFSPLFSTTAGNGLYAQDVTTGASVICSASGFSQ